MFHRILNTALKVSILRKNGAHVFKITSCEFSLKLVFSVSVTTCQYEIVRLNNITTSIEAQGEFK